MACDDCGKPKKLPRQRRASKQKPAPHILPGPKMLNMIRQRRQALRKAMGLTDRRSTPTEPTGTMLQPTTERVQ